MNIKTLASREGSTVVLSKTTLIPGLKKKYVLKGSQVELLGYAKEGLHIKVKFLEVPFSSSISHATKGEVYAISPGALR